jgi:hypothetical protein
MLTRFTVALAAAVLCIAAIANAQDTPAQWATYIQGNCGKEIKAHCKGVPSGQGRVLACLYAFSNKLSPKCEDAVFNSSERLGVAMGALANIKRACEADTRRLCAGVQLGNGNVVSCLTKAKGTVSATCNNTLDAAFLRPEWTDRLRNEEVK